MGEITMKMTQKQLVIVGSVVAAVVLVGGGAFAVSKMRGQAQPTETAAPKKRVALPVNVISVEKRPDMRITPTADGRSVEFTVEALNMPAKETEIELEYQSGSLLQGYTGLLALSKLPATQKVLLGSCSAGGACTYHTDVTGGTLLATFQGGGEDYAVKSDWRYIENKAKETTFTSKDGKFTMSAPELAKVAIAVIYNSPGYPEGAPGTVVSEHYAVGMTGTAPKELELSIRAAEEGELSIVGWDGRTWKSFETKTDGKVVTATAPVMELFLVVKK